jgi:hypothetical protein
VLATLTGADGISQGEAPMTIGDVIPDLDLLGPDGSTVRLADVLTGPTLLIFLRHLA